VDLQKLDWSCLPVFAAVARTGSINAAANELNVSPAKVGRDLDALEETVGRQLLFRTPRGATLTPIGVQLLSRVETMVDTFGAMKEDVANASSVDTRQVSVAAFDGLATYWLARKLPEFHQLNPKIEIMLKVVSNTADLLGGEADIAIQFEEPTVPSTKLISRAAGWIHYVPFASPDYLKVFGVPDNMFDAGKHRILLHSEYKNQMNAWAQGTSAWKEVVPNVLQTNSSTVLVEDCAAGGGIAALPSYLGESEPRIQALSFRPLASLKFWVVHTKHVHDLDRGQTVLNWLRDCFNPARHPWFREAYVAPGQLIDAT
jgi:DNA-binding transcriptional LysR family regulator